MKSHKCKKASKNVERGSQRPRAKLQEGEQEANREPGRSEAAGWSLRRLSMCLGKQNKTEKICKGNKKVEGERETRSYGAGN